MSTISELRPGTVESAGLASVALEELITWLALAADDEDDDDWDDAAEAPIYRDWSEAHSDSIFPGYPLS